MTNPELHHKYQDEQLFRLDQVIRKMTLEGIPEFSTPFQAVLNARSALRINLGFKVPKDVFALLKLFALSPGTITLWLDTENGWMTEARAYPGAPPVYKRASDEVAITILKKEVTPELEADLLTPDEYLGE